MPTKPTPNAQQPPISPNSKGSTLPSPDPDSPPPLVEKVRTRKPGFLNRTLEGKPIRHSYAFRGRKRRKLSGYQNLNGPSRPKALRGPYAGPIAIPEALWNLKREPISEHAKVLLSEYLRRQVFWDLVKNYCMPVGYAGVSILQVQRRRAEVILKELEEVRGPLHWFRIKAVEGFNSGKIAWGRETAWCQIADQFFKFLAGGAECLEDIRIRATGGTSEASIDGEYEGITDLECEILEYTICKHLTAIPTKKGK